MGFLLASVAEEGIGAIRPGIAFPIIVLGFIFAAALFLVALGIGSPRKRSFFLLAGVALAVLSSFLYSLESPLIAVGWANSREGFRRPMIANLGFALLLSLIYFWYINYRRIAALEFFMVSGGLAINIAIAMAVMDMRYGFLSFFSIMSFAFYIVTRTFTLNLKDYTNVLFVFSCLIQGIYLAFLGFAAALKVAVPYVATGFSLAITLFLFSSAFSDIYIASMSKRDAAALQRRQVTATSRSLAKLSSEEETIASLKWIGEAYEDSVKKGDRRLVSFSSLLRQRLVALRKEAIPFREECELESKICQIRGEVSKRAMTLLLDMEVGEMKVPALIFKEILDEVWGQIQESEVVVLVEQTKGVRLSYPSRIFIKNGTLQAIEERCAAMGIGVTTKQGAVVLMPSFKQ